MELIILIVCAVFAFVFQPLVDRIIRKKIHSKGLAIVLSLLIYWVIFMALNGIAALLGFNISD